MLWHWVRNIDILMFTVSSKIYIFWMFGDIHVHRVGDWGRQGGWRTGDMDPVDMILIRLRSGVRHPWLYNLTSWRLVQHHCGWQEVGGRGHARTRIRGGDSDGPRVGGARLLPQLRGLGITIIFGFFVAQCWYARIFGAEGWGRKICASITQTRPNLGKWKKKKNKNKIMYNKNLILLC